MANLNKVMLIGRLTRDPEARTFSNGGKVVKFGFAVNNSRKNKDTGEWENEPVFIDVDAFNKGDFGKLADRIEQLRKGQQIFIEGHLKLDQWTSQDGQKRSKITVVCDNFQYLEPRGESMGGEGGSYSGARSGGAQSRAQAPAARQPAYEAEPDAPAGGGDDEIPF